MLRCSIGVGSYVGSGRSHDYLRFAAKANYAGCCRAMAGILVTSLPIQVTACAEPHVFLYMLSLCLGAAYIGVGPRPTNELVGGRTLGLILDLRILVGWTSGTP